MIRTKIDVSGTEYIDYQRMNVTKVISDSNTSSYYDVELDSPYGRHSNDFNVGQEIEIYADKDADPTTLLLTGIVEEVEFTGGGTEEKVMLRGRDYTARLMDTTIQPTVYTNQEVGSI